MTKKYVYRVDLQPRSGGHREWHDAVEVLDVPLAVVREDEAASEEQIKEFHEDLACALDKAQAPVFQGDFQYGYVVVRISR